MKNMRKCLILHHFVAKNLGFQKNSINIIAHCIIQDCIKKLPVEKENNTTGRALKTCAGCTTYIVRGEKFNRK